MSRCEYHLVAAQREPPMIWIVDEDAGGLSVTNDAVRVCAELHAAHPHARIMYRDSDGRWDELVHAAGVFTEYRPGGPP